MKNTRPTLNRLGHRISQLGILLVLICAILVVPNLSVFDEKLLPDIERRLAELPDYTQEGNAANMIAGFNAASDKNSEEVGKQLVAKRIEKHTQEDIGDLSPQDYQTLLGTTDPQALDKDWLASYPAAQCNPRFTSDCAEVLFKELKEKPITNARLNTQLNRYQELLGKRHFVEDWRAMSPNSLLPTYGNILSLGRIYTANCHANSETSEAIACIQKDMQFWEMALKESQMLLGKMIATNALRFNIQSLSYLLSHNQNLSPEQVQQINRLAESNLSNSFHQVLTSEYRAMANGNNFFNQIPNVSTVKKWLIHLLGQPNATANRFYLQTVAPLEKLSQLSAADFYLATQNPTPALPYSRFNPYNLGGKMVMSENWQLSDYIGRNHDLRGMYLLLQLQVSLYGKEGDLDNLINQSPLKNAYSNKPFTYDKTSREISFTCFNVKDSCTLLL